MDEQQLPPLHKNEVPFYAGEHSPDKYGFGYDKDVKPESAASFVIFTRQDAARAMGSLAIPSSAQPSEMGSEIWLD